MTTNVLEWLEEKAQLMPDKLAIGDPNEDLTFAETMHRAKAAGSFFSEKIKPTEAVVFYTEKSADTLCAMFGAVYAGGFYSVIDIKQPKDRILGILDKLEATFVVADEKNEKAARAFGRDVYLLDEIVKHPIDEERLDKIRAVHVDGNPLYVNFTSGSTGVPKGVCISHRCVIEFISCFVEIFGITEQDILANQAPFDFDVSVKDIYSGLFSGAKVQLIPKKYFTNPMTLIDYLVEKEVTVLIWAVSAMCFVSVMNGLEYRVPKTIRMVMFSGEVLPIKHLNVWQKFLPSVTWVNLYGTTEITCNCTYYVLDRAFALDEIIPIGKAFPNEKVFLLDDADKEVKEPGIEGEICVCGTCVGLGYYAEPEKTAQAFMQNPLNKAYLEPMYRTGDMGKYDADGNLVYTSRKDFQIKHLGHRIELGEIESVVTAREQITRACCIYDENKQRLNLFYTGARESKDLMKELRVVLPPYMLPNALFQLEEMPLNKNGKIDRTALKEKCL